MYKTLKIPELLVYYNPKLFEKLYNHKLSFRTVPSSIKFAIDKTRSDF